MQKGISKVQNLLGSICKALKHSLDTSLATRRSQLENKYREPEIHEMKSGWQARHLKTVSYLYHPKPPLFHKKRSILLSQSKADLWFILCLFQLINLIFKIIVKIRFGKAQLLSRLFLFLYSKALNWKKKFPLANLHGYFWVTWLFRLSLWI